MQHYRVHLKVAGSKKYCLKLICYQKPAPSWPLFLKLHHWFTWSNFQFLFMVIWELNVKFFGLSMRIISNLRTSLMVRTLYALEILCGRNRETKMHNILLSFSFSHRAMLWNNQTLRMCQPYLKIGPKCISVHSGHTHIQIFFWNMWPET